MQQKEEARPVVWAISSRITQSGLFLPTTKMHKQKQAENIQTYLQTNSTDFLFPWRLVEHGLHTEEKHVSSTVISKWILITAWKRLNKLHGGKTGLVVCPSDSVSQCSQDQRGSQGEEGDAEKSDFYHTSNQLSHCADWSTL